MPAFTYQAIDRDGKRLDGAIDALSDQEAITALRGQGYMITSLRAEADDGTQAPRSATRRGSGIGPGMPIRTIDIEVSLQQLAVMLKAGMTLIAALSTLEDQAERRRMADVWAAVRQRIQEGQAIADAMKPHRCFPEFIRQLVAVGEQTGALDDVLVQGAITLERRRVQRTTMMTAMLYPAIVMLMALGVSLYMVLDVIPKLNEFLQMLGRELPAMTQSLVDVSDFIQTRGPWLLMIGVAAIIGVFVARRVPAIRFTTDRLVLRVPMLGTLLRVAASTSFARTLALLLRSGVPILQALRTVERQHANRFIASRVRAVHDAAESGRPLADTMLAKGAFMPMLPRMLAVGEQTGTLDRTLSDVAQFYEGRLQSLLKRWSAFAEPATIFVVGGVVGYVYIAFFMALFAAGGVT